MRGKGGLHVAGWHDAFEPEDQPLAARAFEHGRKIHRDLFEFAHQHIALAHDLVEEAGRQDHVQHRIAGGAGEWIATIGGAMGAGDEVFAHRFLGQHGAEREAAADALGRRDHVRFNARPFMREQLAGAPHATLDFVEAQENAKFVAGAAQILHELDVGRSDPAFALHRLNHDPGGLPVDRIAHRVEVVQRHMHEAFDRRAEAFEVMMVAGRGQRRQGAAMERAFEADDFVAFRMPVGEHRPAHHFDHAFVGLSPRIAEEHRVGKGRRHQPLRQHFRLRNAVQIGDVHHLVRLRRNRVGEALMAMADGGGGDAGAEIEVTSPVGRPQPGAFAPLESKGGTVVVRQQSGDHCWIVLDGSWLRDRVSGLQPQSRPCANGFGTAEECAGLGREVKLCATRMRDLRA